MNGTNVAPPFPARASRLAWALFGVLLAAEAASAQLDWRDKSPGTSPPARSDHALVFDSIRNRTVLFGGIDGAGTILGDTWEWDGTAWTQLSPANSPAPRTGLAMAFDGSRGRVVLFGGDDGATQFADTWEFDGTDWIDVTPGGTSPAGRSRHTMAFDPIRGVTVIFGGSPDQEITYLGDTWEWNGTSWSDAAPASPPSERSRAAMAYSNVLGSMVLYGGSRLNDPMGPMIFDETWQYDGLRWTQVFPPLTPFGTFGYQAAYDANRDRVVLVGVAEGFGGPLFVGSEYDGSTWAPQDIRTIPSPRFGHALAYDPVRKQVVMFGGTDGFSAIGETWELGNTAVFIASVIPQTGSELGGDFVTVRGGGFTTAEDTQIAFDGVPGTVLSVVDSETLTARTAAGTGEATVTVDNSAGNGVLERGFRYLAPALAARLGNVNTGVGDREDVLTVNGSIGDSETRVVSFGTIDPFSIDMAAPSTRERAPFVLYAWVGAGSDATVTAHPFDLGRTVFPTPLSGGPGRMPKHVWKNISGHDTQLGSQTLPSSPAPSNVFTSPLGARRAVTFALQGFIVDDGSHIPQGASVTNAVIVRVQ